MTRIILSLGSNINREHNIRFAIQQIKAHYGEVDLSPVYDAVAMGFSGGNFLNLVAGFNSNETVHEIRAKLRSIEVQAGRARGRKTFDNRRLDIDILLYGNQNFRLQGDNIPRVEIEKYAYVLKPLSDLYPDIAHPIYGQTFQKMMIDLGDVSEQLRQVLFEF